MILKKNIHPTFYDYIILFVKQKSSKNTINLRFHFCILLL